MKRERILLLWAGLFITVNQIALILVQDRAWSHLGVVGLWLAVACASHWGLNQSLPQRDPYIFPAAMLLAGWGLNLVARLLPSYAERQSAWVLLSVAAMLFITYLPNQLRWLRQYRYFWLLSGLGLLWVTILVGVNPSGFGPRLWLGFGDIFFQPSEILKILLVIFLASYMAEHQPIFHQAGLRSFAPMLVMWGLCVVLLVWQRDLGTASIFFLIFLLMLYLASGRLLVLLGGMGLLCVALVGAYFVFPIVKLRVDVWLNPWLDANNTSFQVVQSLMAIADGGVMGSGIGGGIPHFIPVVHTDFAYAAIIEEWGLVGAVGVLGTLFVLVARGFHLAIHLEEKPFHAYLAAGIAILFGVQSLVILGGTLSLIPLTGVTLPFVSYGGSSLLSSFIGIGLLLTLSRHIMGESER